MSQFRRQIPLGEYPNHYRHLMVSVHDNSVHFNFTEGHTSTGTFMDYEEARDILVALRDACDTIAAQKLGVDS